MPKPIETTAAAIDALPPGLAAMLCAAGAWLHKQDTSW